MNARRSPRLQRFRRSPAKPASRCQCDAPRVVSPRRAGRPPGKRKEEREGSRGVERRRASARSDGDGFSQVRLKSVTHRDAWVSGGFTDTRSRRSAGVLTRCDQHVQKRPERSYKTEVTGSSPVQRSEVLRSARGAHPAAHSLLRMSARATDVSVAPLSLRGGGIRRRFAVANLDARRRRRLALGPLPQLRRVWLPARAVDLRSSGGVPGASGDRHVRGWSFACHWSRSWLPCWLAFAWAFARAC
jgi:hypothetical protein